MGRIVLGLLGLTLTIVILLQNTNIALFHSRGMIAHEQRNLMIITVAILLVIAIPTLAGAFYVAWKYRESNARASRDPKKTGRSRLLVPGIWLVPTAFAVVLALIMWPAAHKLDPKASIAADAKPLTIQVIAMRWKWLFIYPEQHVATVNFVQLPAHTPIKFELTADETPMSSFWIPNLSGQLYAMTGHMNQLHIIADTPGDYTGSSAEINGAGFSGMKFTTRVGSQEAFDFWVKETKLNGRTLDATEYQRLLQPSEHNSAAFYSVADNGLYDTVLMKYMGPSNDTMPAMNDDMHMTNTEMH